MEIVLVLIPLSLILLTVAVMIFRWAVRNGQYDDLEGPAHRILFDDDLAERSERPANENKGDTSQPDQQDKTG